MSSGRITVQGVMQPFDAVACNYFNQFQIGNAQPRAIWTAALVACSIRLNGKPFGVSVFVFFPHVTKRVTGSQTQ